MIRSVLFAPVKIPLTIARVGARLVRVRIEKVLRDRRPAPPPPPVPERRAEPAPAAPSIDPRSLQTSPEEIFELQKNGVKVVFVDVREPAERASGIIEGALLIPSGQVGARYEELSSGDEIVLYCASGMRSTNAAMFLRGKGYEKAKSLVGGFSHWQRDGGTVVTPG